MLFVDLKKYPLRTLDGLAELAKKYKKPVFTSGPLLTWGRLYSKKELPKSIAAPGGPAIALIGLALGMLRLAQDAFEQSPGSVTFAQYVYEHIEREGVSDAQAQASLSPEEKAFLDGIKGRAAQALGLAPRKQG